MSSPENASEFVEELREESNWYAFGVHLHIPVEKLKTIRRTHREEVDACLIEMYHYLEKMDKLPTWEEITDALEKTGNKLLAREISTRHGNQPLEDRSTLLTRVKECAKEQEFYDPQPIFVKEDVSEEFLELSSIFTNLVLKLRRIALSSRNHRKLASEIQSILYNECGIKLVANEQNATMHEVFRLLNERLAYHNYQLFKVVLENCFPKEKKLRRQLEEFKTKRKEFKKSTKISKLKGLICKHPAYRKGKKVEVKVIEEWGDMNLKKFEKLLREIMEPVNCLHKITVKEGCVCIGWEIPTDDEISHIVRPLARSDEFMKTVGILSLKVADEVIYERQVPKFQDERSSLESDFISAVSVGQMEAVCVLLAVNGDPFSLMKLVRKEALRELCDTKGWSLLHFACSRGYGNVADMLSSEYFIPDVSDVPDSNGWTPLMVAINNFHVEVAQLMISRANVNSANKDGTTPIYIAAQTRQLVVVYDLLGAGSNPNVAKQNGMTPLMIASKNGSNEIVSLLLGKEVELDAANDKGMTAINFASSDGHSEVVSLLIESGANPEIPNDRGYTPLMSASEKGFSNVVDVLAPKVDVTSSNKNGLTALHLASKPDIMAVVSTLLLSGADPLARTKGKGFTPFLSACDEGHDAIVNTILQLAKPDLVPHLIGDTTRDGKTGLYYASRRGSKGAVITLLHRGADPNCADKDGSTPLMVASYKGFTDIVELLVKRKARVNDRHKKGTTALYLASDKGHTEVVDILLECGADPNLAEHGSGRWSPLMVACSKGHSDIVQLLLHSKPDVDYQAIDGKTALHIASMYGYQEITKALLDAKANITLKTTKGQTACDLAVSRGHLEITSIIDVLQTN